MCVVFSAIFKAQCIAQNAFVVYKNNKTCNQ